MATCFGKLFCVFATAVFFLIGISILVVSSLELIFATIMSFKYYGPSLMKNGTEDLALTLFYAVCLFVQVVNLLGSLTLIKVLVLTNYNERWFAYDTLSLISVSASLSLIVSHKLTGVDFYKTSLEPELYYQAANFGDVRCRKDTCFFTEIYVYHQVNQCCGWYSAQELTGLGRISGGNHSDELPQFCCHFDATLPHTNQRFGFQSKWAPMSPCHLNSIGRFQNSCSSLGASFFEVQNVPVISHPCSLGYSIFKLFMALTFTFIKKNYFGPQAEGIYALNVIA